MPRTSRFAVEFPDQYGVIWTAEFKHKHARNEGTFEEPKLVGIPHPYDSEVTPGRHLTTCYLSTRNSGHFVVGHALCSMKDEYVWKRGVEFAFKKALEAAGFIMLSKNGRRHVTTMLKTEFVWMLESFWREMEVKDYAPHVPVVPPENQHGLGYSGMD